jgi:hypothetical protein
MHACQTIALFVLVRDDRVLLGVLYLGGMRGDALFELFGKEKQASCRFKLKQSKVVDLKDLNKKKAPNREEKRHAKARQGTPRTPRHDPGSWQLSELLFRFVVVVCGYRCADTRINCFRVSDII